MPWIPCLLWVLRVLSTQVNSLLSDPPVCSYPPSLAALVGAGGKGQAVKLKLLLEPLKVQTNTSGMLRSLLGGGRAIKK